MTSEQALRDVLLQRLVPRPQKLMITEGKLAWSGEAFALQLQGSFSAAEHQQLVAQLQHFVRPGVQSTERLARESSLVVYCAGESARLAGSLADAQGADKPSVTRGEAYTLDITADGILLSASTQLGVLRGAQTLAQVLAYSSKNESAGLPCLRIEDQPAFGWRGVLIDVARHFIELPVLLRTLDGMAHHKLNVLHLHLTDDQAFRFPSLAYPKLNDSGSSYTHAELRELVAYAQARGIRVIPELDMPGHTTCWLAAYPQWSLYEVKPTQRFGVHKGCLNPTVDETYDVIATLLAEFAEVFPDECVHIGGDEVHPLWWSDHPEVKGFMRERGFETPRDLQAYFNARVGNELAGLGKRMLVWDEAVHDTLPDTAVVQAWRGMTARDAAVARGHQCIVSAPYYLDLFYPTDLHTQFAPLLPLEQAIAAEDVMLADERLAHVADGLEWTKQWRDRPDDLAADDAGKGTAAESLAESVLGGEACLWSELVSSELLDVRLWSRLPLIAELFWSGVVEDPAYTRTAHSLSSWQSCGGPSFAIANGELLSQQQYDLLAPRGIDARVAPLLAVLEPTKWYARLLGRDALVARLQGMEMPQARPYTLTTPLRTIGCVISPQSFVCAQFSELLERWQSGPLSAADQVTVKQWIADWGEQHSALAELRLADEDSLPLQELAQRLRQLSQVVQSLLDNFGRQDFGLDAAELAGAELAGAGLAQWGTPVGELLLAPALALLRVRQQIIGVQRTQ